MYAVSSLFLTRSFDRVDFASTGLAGFSEMHWMQYVRTAVRRPQKAYTLADIATHTDPRRSVWMAIHGRVYDVTAYMRYHPGGIPQLMKGAGKDCTKMFGEFSCRAVDARAAVGDGMARGVSSLWQGVAALFWFDADWSCPRLFLFAASASFFSSFSRQNPRVRQSRSHDGAVADRHAGR